MARQVIIISSGSLSAFTAGMMDVLREFGVAVTTIVKSLADTFDGASFDSIVIDELTVIRGASAIQSIERPDNPATANGVRRRLRVTMPHYWPLVPQAGVLGTP